MRRDVQKIFKMTPLNKQVMMFSATMPDEMRTVCKKFMHNVSYYSIAPSTIHAHPPIPALPYSLLIS